MSQLPVDKLQTNAKALDLGSSSVYHLPDWHKLTHPQRLKVIRRIAASRGRDPRIAKLVINILRKSGARPRQYTRQAAAILKWVQDPKNIYYVNEPGERLQDPIYTIKAGFGDCFAEGTLLLRDDMEFVKVQDIEIGDRIWGRDRWSTVVNKWEKGVLPVTRIGVNNGSKIRVTEGHKVYVRSCEKHGITCPDIVGKRSNCERGNRKFEYVRIPVSELQPGMQMLQPEKINRENDPSLTETKSWLVGAYIAEGWSEDSRVGISGKDGNWKEQTKNYVREIADQEHWNTRTHEKYISIKNREVAEWFTQCGKGAVNKHIPAEVLRQADLTALDTGLRLDASANSRGEGWTYGTISQKLAVQYRVLQRMLGRSTSMNLVEDHGGFGKNPIYRVGVRNPTKNRDRRLLVSSIEREVENVPCWDIATDDHYVYLPESDCTVSNCDDQVLMLGALFESIGLPWKLVLSGRGPEGKTRYIEDGALPPGITWTHIYCMVGDRPFAPSRWYFCEPTVEGVPLGWDVISGDHRFLPEMLSKPTGPATIASSPLANSRYRPPPLPPADRRSPAYAEALSGVGSTDLGAADLGTLDFGKVEEELLGQLDEALENSRSSSSSAIGGAVAATVAESDTWNWSKIGVAVITGVSVSVATSLLLDFIKGDGMYKGHGTFLERWGKHGAALSAQSFLTPPGV